MTELQKLLSRAKVQQNGCILIGNLKSKNRYWTARADGTWMNAHRAAWVLAFGRIPPRMEVCHRCDNTRCVNPEHLFLGSHAQNMRDCLSKGRKNPPRGERCSFSKLKSRDVQTILMLHGHGVSVRVIAKLVPLVTQSAIYKIVEGVRWRHVHRPEFDHAKAA